MEELDCFLMILVSLGIIGMGLWLLKQAVPLDWRRLGLASSTWYGFVCSLLIPSVGIAIWEDPPKVYLTLGLLLGTVVCIPVGVLAANAVWRFRKCEMEKFYRTPMEFPMAWERNRLRLLTALIVLFSVIFFFEIGTVPLWEALWHPGEDRFLNRLREKITGEIQSPFHYIYFMIRQFGWAFVLSCWLGIAWTEHWNLKRRVGFLLLFVFGLFYCSATLVRSPAVVMFIVIFFFYYLFQGGRIPISRILLVPILAFAVPILVLFLYNPLRSWESILIGIGQRIFYAPAKLNFQYVELFPQKIDFLYGRGIGKLSQVVSLLDPAYEYFPISQEMYRHLFPTSPYRGSAPAPFVGMAYANWGGVGPPLYGLVIGFILQSIQIWLIRQRKSLFLLAAHAVLFYSFFEINRTDFFATLFSYGGLVVPVFLAFLQAKSHTQNCTSTGILSCKKLFSGEV